MSMFRAISAAAALSVAAFSVWADDSAVQFDPAVITSLKYGLICADEQMDSRPEPDTVLGYVSEPRHPQEIVVETLVVPLLRGMSFGMLAEIAPNAPPDIGKMTVTHPPFNESGATQQSWSFGLGSGSQNMHFFTFDFPDEEVPGTWAFEATAQGKTIYKVVFEVVDGSGRPTLADICKGDALTS